MIASAAGIHPDFNRRSRSAGHNRLDRYDDARTRLHSLVDHRNHVPYHPKLETVPEREIAVKRVWKAGKCCWWSKG